MTPLSIWVEEVTECNVLDRQFQWFQQWRWCLTAVLFVFRDYLDRVSDSSIWQSTDIKYDWDRSIMMSAFDLMKLHRSTVSCEFMAMGIKISMTFFSLLWREELFRQYVLVEAPSSPVSVCVHSRCIPVSFYFDNRLTIDQFRISLTKSVSLWKVRSSRFL